MAPPFSMTQKIPIWKRLVEGYAFIQVDRYIVF